ncbi:hypothetical protein [Lederbergia citrea]|uniref:hypothetical protein n=1 Tax=Lederbergia citrea TaxID=2833581 RepID=UPI001BC8D518|nr:hypothetical protein [Lederbergia citrea]MBS4177213.1 hypothetical protein [Lederbergia citrea]
MLTYRDVLKLYPETRGIKEEHISFGSITLNSSSTQLKGLYFGTAADLDLGAAIANGAIAAIWPKEISLPAYTPNHFPVFFAHDSIEAMVVVVRKYTNKITLEKREDLTNMILSKQDLQNEKIYNEIHMLLDGMQPETKKGRKQK